MFKDRGVNYETLVNILLFLSDQFSVLSEEVWGHQMKRVSVSGGLLYPYNYSGKVWTLTVSILLAHESSPLLTRSERTMKVRASTFSSHSRRHGVSNYPLLLQSSFTASTSLRLTHESPPLLTRSERTVKVRARKEWLGFSIQLRGKVWTGMPSSTRLLHFHNIFTFGPWIVSISNERREKN